MVNDAPAVTAVIVVPAAMPEPVTDDPASVDKTAVSVTASEPLVIVAAPSARVTTTAVPAAVAAALIVKEVLGVTAVMVAPGGMPVPLTTEPTSVDKMAASATSAEVAVTVAASVLAIETPVAVTVTVGRTISAPYSPIAVWCWALGRTAASYRNVPGLAAVNVYGGGEAARGCTPVVSGTMPCPWNRSPVASVKLL